MDTSETRVAGTLIEATVLIVDDSVEFTDVLRSFLEQHHYHAVAVHSGLEALAYLSEGHRVDAILLDVMMPGMDGWETCRWLREITDVPILMLTALGHESDLVRGLNLGADDYLVKPFHFHVLKARLEARLRRARLSGQDGSYLAYSDGELYIDLPKREVRLQGQPISLSPTEFRVLACLVRHAGVVVKHETLLTEAWGSDTMQDVIAIKLYVRYLREKIETDPSQPRYILTEWGEGYRFCNMPVPGRTPIQALQMERA